MELESEIGTPPPGRPIKILLVDDSRDFLASAADFLTRPPQFTVVGKCLDGESAMRAIASLRPDLVLVDFVMPGMGGLDLTQAIKSLPEAPRVIMVTLLEGSAYRVAAADAGADAYVFKGEFATHLPGLMEALFQPVGTAG
jgi:DNA-binding NarL/FixJ family response regulator